MANEGGGNQFGNYTLQPKYGDVAKQTQLLKEAPISGAPQAAQNLNAPRRAQRQAQRPKVQAAPPPPTPAPLPPQALNAITWGRIASLPGVSPLVQQYAQEAQSA